MKRIKKERWYSIEAPLRYAEVMWHLTLIPAIATEHSFFFNLLSCDELFRLN